MNDRQHRADGKGELVAERHVNQNSKERKERGDDGRFLDFHPDASRPRSRCRSDVKIGGGKGGHQGVGHVGAFAEGRDDLQHFLLGAFLVLDLRCRRLWPSAARSLSTSTLFSVERTS